MKETVEEAVLVFFLSMLTEIQGEWGSMDDYDDPAGLMEDLQENNKDIWFASSGVDPEALALFLRLVIMARQGYLESLNDRERLLGNEGSLAHAVDTFIHSMEYEFADDAEAMDQYFTDVEGPCLLTGRDEIAVLWVMGEL